MNTSLAVLCFTSVRPAANKLGQIQQTLPVQLMCYLSLFRQIKISSVSPLACLMFAADLVAARVAERGAGGAIRQCHLKDKLELNFLYLVFILNKLHQNVRLVHLTMRL